MNRVNGKVSAWWGMNRLLCILLAKELIVTLVQLVFKNCSLLKAVCCKIDLFFFSSENKFCGKDKGSKKMSISKRSWTLSLSTQAGRCIGFSWPLKRSKLKHHKCTGVKMLWSCNLRAVIQQHGCSKIIVLIKISYVSVGWTTALTSPW